MSRYLANDVYQFLRLRGYEPEGDEFTGGSGWSNTDGRDLLIPYPNGEWFDAEQIDDLLAN